MTIVNNKKNLITILTNIQKQKKKVTQKNNNLIEKKTRKNPNKIWMTVLKSKHLKERTRWIKSQKMENFRIKKRRSSLTTYKFTH